MGKPYVWMEGEEERREDDQNILKIVIGKT
jgi:hypothetical protein